MELSTKMTCQKVCVPYLCELALLLLRDCMYHLVVSQNIHVCTYHFEVSQNVAFTFQKVTY